MSRELEQIGTSRLEGLRALVTGGAGFIGTHLVRRLLTLGVEVTVVDDMSAPSARPCPNAAHFHQLTLPDPAFSDIVAKGRFEFIFHLAGAAYVPPSIDDPASDLQNNAQVTLHVLETLRHKAPTARLVFTSSAAVYGSPTVLPINEQTPVRPVSPYGVSKYTAEQYVALYARLHGLCTAALRLFSVFGPGQRKQVIYDLIANLRKNPRNLFVHGTGTETRDFVYVEDAVGAAVLVMTQAPLQGEPYNVATGTAVTIAEVVGSVTSVLGVEPTVRFSGELRPGDALHWRADIGRLRSLGFAPSVSLAQGIERIVRWFDETAD